MSSSSNPTSSRMSSSQMTSYCIADLRLSPIPTSITSITSSMSSVSSQIGFQNINPLFLMSYLGSVLPLAGSIESQESSFLLLLQLLKTDLDDLDEIDYGGVFLLLFSSPPELKILSYLEINFSKSSVVSSLPGVSSSLINYIAS